MVRIMTAVSGENHLRRAAAAVGYVAVLDLHLRLGEFRV